MTDRVIDAYRYPRRIQPGCQHQLACKCDPPYWLRMPTPAELARWAPEAKPEPRDSQS